MTTNGGPAYLRALARFAAETRLEDMPAAVVTRGRWILIDSIGAVAAGMQVAEMKALIKAQTAAAAPGRCSVIGAGLRSEPATAAQLNGTAGTWLEMDEGNIYAKGHPGIQVVPAAVAMAEHLRAPGKALVEAVIVGYEASSRISRASQTRLAVHPHGTYGAIGAAVAVARLAGYDGERMARIINVASTLGLATSRNTLKEGATVRNIYTGSSGYMGVLAHRMVEAGFTGESDGVKSVYGAVYADAFDPALVVAGLGKEFLIAKSYFKLHSCGRYIHSALDLILKVMAGRGRIAPESVERIDFRSYFLAATLSGQDVGTSFGARFSVPFAVASLVAHGRPGLANFEEAAVADPAVQALTRRVFITENPEYTKAWPAKQLCDVRIRFKDGTTAEAKAEYMKGENENPHSDDEMKEKFLTLGGAAWGRARAEEVFQALAAVERVPDFGAFTERRPL
ncbi:MAG: MmgE/PrpD family protein [Proteobacteria bacterium]|nr:MmgE/PrpD family protein [Pseudomonadota bacterium]